MMPPPWSAFCKTFAGTQILWVWLPEPMSMEAATER
jgi:hypothetical protein